MWSRCKRCTALIFLFLGVWFRGCGVMVISDTFNNISVISWRSLLLVEETVVSGENHRSVASHWQTLAHNVVSSTPRLSVIRTHDVCGDRHWLHSVDINSHYLANMRIRTQNISGNTNCIGSYKSNTTTTVPSVWV